MALEVRVAMARDLAQVVLEVSGLVLDLVTSVSVKLRKNSPLCQTMRSNSGSNLRRDLLQHSYQGLRTGCSNQWLPSCHIPPL